LEKILAVSAKEKVLRKFPNKHEVYTGLVVVQRAGIEDVEQIYDIACSVGTALKDPYQGFLIDNYISSPQQYKEMFREAVGFLDHFYVAKKNNNVVGFLMAYTREQWLQVDPLWLKEIRWDLHFDHEARTENFVLVSKTAIHANLTSRGIGSCLYERLLRDLRAKEIHDLFGETVISPVPNFASLAFRIKQKYKLAGIRYGIYKGQKVTDLIYHRFV